MVKWLKHALKSRLARVLYELAAPHITAHVQHREFALRSALESWAAESDAALEKKLAAELLAHKESLDGCKEELRAFGLSLPDQVIHHTHEELTRLQSPKQRHVACPTCGKSFSLSGLNIPFDVRSVTMVCNNCNGHFEVRPSLFWNKLEVERRQ